MSTMSTEQLESLAKEFRYVITDMICRAGSGHLGGSLSLVEIVTTLYYRIMNVHADNHKWEERDRLILSKGHAGPVLYVVLAYLGFFPKEWLKTLNQNGTNLPSHVDHNKTPGIDMTAGSLGQGLSCACGMSYAAKLNKKNYNVFCIIGDGESNEGQIWEAAMFAGHNKLDNLVVICDYNKMQIDGKTDDVVTLEPLVDKWRAFNFEVFEMDGHNWDDIYSTINRAIEVKGKPSMIIAHTIKGKGNAEVENKVSSHNIKINNQADYEKYMKGLGYTIPLPY